MIKQKIESVYFEKLKGLHEVTIKFDKPLTAIMGVNGAGKTTVIHALACLYESDGNGDNYRFPYFFIPNTDATWRDSKFIATFSIIDSDGTTKILPSRTYKKDLDRWSPRYETRPKRNVYYIGINTCLPEIEQTSVMSVIHYTSRDCADRISQKVISKAAYILNKDYSILTANAYQKKSLIGIRTNTGLKYSSLSMGSGEQRTIRILQTIYDAEAYSLILIDEIDLLMHISALRRLIEVLYKIASDKNLQVVFTTHSLLMSHLSESVGIQYIDTIKKPTGELKSFIYSKINDGLIYSLTGESTYPLKIYVEDEFAKGVVKSLACKIGISSKVSITKFGAIMNAFTLASGMVLKGENTENCIVLLDGDKYRSSEEQLEQIKKVLCGTEDDIENRREQVLAIISQFTLPKDTPPEKFLYDRLVETGDTQDEIVNTALRICAVSDTHQWIGEIQKRVNESEEYLVRRIIDIISQSQEWNNYIAPISDWLEQHKNV